MIKFISKQPGISKLSLLFFSGAIFCAVFLSSSIPEARADITSGDYTYTLDGGNATITGYTGAGGAISLPAALDGYPVTAIGANAFLNKTSITSVVIPSGVLTIGDSAFSGCTALASATIPDGVTSLGAGAFHYCAALTSIAIPNSVLTIGAEAFRYCTSLSSVTLGNSLTTIGADAFIWDESLASITIPNSVTTIGKEAFYDTGLISITIPDSVTNIGYSAFTYCPHLTSVNIGSGVTSLGVNTFYYSFALAQINVASGNPNYSSEDGVLFNKLKTTLITYPPSKPGISYTIPASVTSLSDNAFYGSTILTSIIIPDTVTSIGDYVFEGCSVLANVTFGSGLTNIGFSMFKDCTALTSLTIPINITSIDDYAFSGCSALTSLIIPDSVTSIGPQAFFDCSALSSVTFGNGLTSIGDVAFFNTALTSVTIPASITNLGDFVFFGDQALTQINVAAGNPNYSSEDGVLFNKAKTTLILYPSGKLETSYTIPVGVANIFFGAFYYYGHSLTSVIIPASVTSIGDLAFNTNPSLTAAYFLGNAPTLGSDVFGDCAAGFSAYYLNGTTGWTNPWNGYPTALSSRKAITSFSFNALSPAVTGTIDQANRTISLNVPSGTDLNALVAFFSTTGESVKIGSTAQVSGTTVNNFHDPKIYTVTAPDSTTQDYIVTVNVSAAPAPAGGSSVYQPPPAVGSGAESKTLGIGQTGNIGEVPAAGLNYLTYVNSTADFSVPISGTTGGRSESHQLTIDSLDIAAQTVQFTIYSIPQTLNLKLGQTVLVDLNNDGIKDLEVKFAGLIVNRVELTIKSSLGAGEAQAAAPVIIPVSNTPPKIPATVALSSKYPFKRNLSTGSIGADVKELQKYLNARGFLLAKSGPGSPGRETTKFGALTRAAVIKFQKAKNIKPAAGYFGPITRKAVNGK